LLISQKWWSKSDDGQMFPSKILWWAKVTLKNIKARKNSKGPLQSSIMLQEIITYTSKYELDMI
jgi:hypothetical protein